MEPCQLDHGHSDGWRGVRTDWIGAEILPIQKAGITMNLLNWGLLKNPYNWFVVILMVMIAGFAGHLVLSAAGIEPQS